MASSLCAQRIAPALTEHDLSTLNDALSLRESTVQDLAVTADDDGTLTVDVTLEGVPRTLRLQGYSMRSETFQILVQDTPNGPLMPVAAPPLRTFRGSVDGLPGARVAASLSDDGLSALSAVIRTREAVYAVQPAAALQRAIGVPAAAGARTHVVFRADDWLNDAGHTCGVDHAAFTPDLDEVAIADGGVSGTGLSVVDVAIDTDVEFFQLNGGSVANTVFDIENMMNAVEGIYERDVTITYEITTIVVRTVEPDPYTATNAGSLLCQFRGTWNTTPESFIQRDTTHLFSGKNLDGSTIGVAFVGVICNPNGFVQGCGNGNVAYGLSQSRFTTALSSRVALTAHELGHNWGASHCSGSNCYIMCASLGGCGGISGSNLKFGPDATAQILNHKASRSCLLNQPDPIALPFEETFATSTISLQNWTYIRGAVVSPAALNEPSGALSLNLDAAGTEPYRDDEIRTNFLLLGATGTPTMTYSTQHVGVSSGGTLFVDYWNNALRWVPLDAVVSNGVDQSAFVQHTHRLPTDARHDEFRIRFRTAVEGSSADWFIDDVYVRDECFSNTECNDCVFCNGEEQCINLACESGAVPCAADQSCDETFQTCFDPTCPAPLVAGYGARYVSVNPQGSGPVGLLVGPACDLSTGWYLSTPSSPDRLSGPASSAGVAPFLTPAQWGGTVYSFGDLIVPNTTYFARSDCGAAGMPRLSAIVTARTPIWGDTAGTVVNGRYTAPNGVVDVLDGTAILDFFRGAAGAPPLPRTDLTATDVSECRPDRAVDIVDVVNWVDAFRGMPFEPPGSCPSPCP